MIKFLDGPAAGVVLPLRRAPLYLRVIRDQAGKFDALDQLSDAPQLGEAIFAYRRAKKKSPVHLCIRGKNHHLSGWYPVAEYAVVGEQPDDATLHETERWRAWALAQAARPATEGTTP